jgi:hypothetical protein
VHTDRVIHTCFSRKHRIKKGVVAMTGLRMNVLVSMAVSSVSQSLEFYWHQCCNITEV